MKDSNSYPYFPIKYSYPYFPIKYLEVSKFRKIGRCLLQIGNISNFRVKICQICTEYVRTYPDLLASLVWYKTVKMNRSKVAANLFTEEMK